VPNCRNIQGLYKSHGKSDENHGVMEEAAQKHHETPPGHQFSVGFDEF
jgi:hypothetical protein